jgi:hypothetical protein
VKFDKLHTNNHSESEFVPVIGDLMPARWAFEALAVKQFKDNGFEKKYFKSHLQKSQIEYYTALIDKLTTNLKVCRDFKDSTDQKSEVQQSFERLNFHLDELTGLTNIIPGSWKSSLNEGKFNNEVYRETNKYLKSLKNHFDSLLKAAFASEDSVTNSLDKSLGKDGRINLQNKYENKSLRALVLDLENLEYTRETPHKIIQKHNPGYLKGTSKYGRTQYYAPSKMICNKEISTFLFNLMVLWIVLLVLYLSLYYKLLRKLVEYLENLKFIMSANKDL